jgi:hypothetical protein
MLGSGASRGSRDIPSVVSFLDPEPTISVRPPEPLLMLRRGVRYGACFRRRPRCSLGADHVSIPVGYPPLNLQSKARARPASLASLDWQGRGDLSKVFAAALRSGARGDEDRHADRQHH